MSRKHSRYRRKVIFPKCFDYGYLLTLWKLEEKEKEIESIDSDLIVILDYIYNIQQDHFDKCRNSGDYQWNNHHPDCKYSQMCTDLRYFLKQLSKCDMYYKNVWRSVKNIQDNENFLRIVKVLLPFMWQ